MIASPSSMMRSPVGIRSATTSETAERQCGTSPVPSRPLSPSCDLDLDPVWVGEVHPVPLPSRLQPGGFQLLLGLISSVATDGVAVMVQAGSLALEQRQEEVVAAAQEAVVLATIPDDLQPQVLDVKVSGPGHATDIQGDVIQTRGLKGAAFALACLGHTGHHAQGRPESHQSGSKLAAGQQAPLEVLNERFGDVGLHDQPLLKVSPVKNSQKIVVFRRLEALQFRAALGLRGGLGESSFAEGSGESRLPVAPPRVPPAFR